LFVGGLAFTQMASAHECTTNPETGVEECGPAAVYPDWRPNYIPLMDLRDRESEQERRDAQRWRDENGCETQYCVWADPTLSVDDEAGPATVHAGTAGDHSLGEAAHSDEGHEDNEFGNHDTHGGAIYADVCLGSDEGASYEGNAGACTGMQDTQVGVTVVDHLTCPAGCADEYHIVRPLDPEYTQEQVDESITATQTAVSDPVRHICGYEYADPSC
jgi:hypothetical protein